MNCNKYYINDLISDILNLKIIFVLESPYSSEVIHGHPLAGSSGLSISIFLQNVYDKIDPDLPIGCQIYNKKINNIGIINCSKYPLDENVYSCLEIRSTKLIKSLESIRKNQSSKVRKDAFTNKVHQHLLKKFKVKVNKIHSLNTSVVFIPCGELARNFIAECKLDDKNKYLKIVPHPSRNQWNYKFYDCYDFMDFISNKLNEI